MTASAHDATALGSVAPVMSPDLIRQVPDGVPAKRDVVPGGDPRGAPRGDACATSRVFLLGEDIGKHGGAFGVTRTLFDQFGPERVRNTPDLGEHDRGRRDRRRPGGHAPGRGDHVRRLLRPGHGPDRHPGGQAALHDRRPVHACPGSCACPRAAAPARARPPSTRQSLEVWFAHIPGLKVVLPSTPYDAKGLHEGRHPRRQPGHLPGAQAPLCLQGPRARRGLRPAAEPVRRQARRAPTSPSWPRATWSGTPCWRPRCWRPRGSASRWSTSAPSPRSTRRPSARSARKTGRVVVVAEACRSYGPANEWAMVAMEQAWDRLRAPIVRVAGRDSPIPFANSLENGVWPGTAGRGRCDPQGRGRLDVRRVQILRGRSRGEDRWRSKSSSPR